MAVSSALELSVGKPDNWDPCQIQRPQRWGRDTLLPTWSPFTQLWFLPNFAPVTT